MSEPVSERAVPVALCLGGLDPSAGAGILRDVLTLAEIGVYPMGIPTAETLQNGLACARITSPSMSARERLELLRPHLGGVWGVKLGLCSLALEELRSVVSLLADLGPTCRIWDPIQAPTSGVGLHDAPELRRMATLILGQGGWVVSPNRPEAATFGALGEDASPETLARAFLDAGASAVWLKGGHAEGSVEDVWVDPTGVTSLGVRPRLAGDRRGTGCTLAAAWLGFRLRGADDINAARQACEWLQERWQGAVRPGGAGRPSFAPVAS